LSQVARIWHSFEDLGELAPLHIVHRKVPAPVGLVSAHQDAIFVQDLKFSSLTRQRILKEKQLTSSSPTLTLLSKYLTFEVVPGLQV